MIETRSVRFVTTLTVLLLTLDPIVLAAMRVGKSGSHTLVQALTAAVLILALHGMLLRRHHNGRPTSLVFLILLLFLGISAAAAGYNGTIGAAVFLYGLMVGFTFAKATVAVGGMALWVIFYALLRRFDAPWELADLPVAIEETRGFVYLSLPAIVDRFAIAKLERSQSKNNETIRVLKTSVEELAAANLSYNAFVQMAESQAARHERNRITREIHDGVGYALTNLIMLAESAQDTIRRSPKDGAEQLALIRNHARLALNDTRRALTEMREVEQGLLVGQPAIEHMLEIFQQATGVEVETEFLLPKNTLDNEAVFPVVYRLVQEALTNSFRHGHASRVGVRMSLLDALLIVEISDNGSAPKNVVEGIGLQGMRERLGEVGGELSHFGHHGFTVIARIPFGP